MERFGFAAVRFEVWNRIETFVGCAEDDHGSSGRTLGRKGLALLVRLLEGVQPPLLEIDITSP
jgi:hypothetical protein